MLRDARCAVLLHDIYAGVMSQIHNTITACEGLADLLSHAAGCLRKRTTHVLGTEFQRMARPRRLSSLTCLNASGSQCLGRLSRVASGRLYFRQPLCIRLFTAALACLLVIHNLTFLFSLPIANVLITTVCSRITSIPPAAEGAAAVHPRLVRC